MCGILTDRDIAMKVTGEQRDPLTTMVEEVMISEITSRTSRSTEMRTGSRVHTPDVRRIPIMDSLETVLGIVTMDDLIALLGNEISEMGEHGLGTLALEPANGASILEVRSS